VSITAALTLQTDFEVEQGSSKSLQNNADRQISRHR